MSDPACHSVYNVAAGFVVGKPVLASKEVQLWLEARYKPVGGSQRDRPLRRGNAIRLDRIVYEYGEVYANEEASRSRFSRTILRSSCGLDNNHAKKAKDNK